MNIDEGQYPPPQRGPKKPWDEKRSGYGCSITRGCATWFGAVDPTTDLVRRSLTNPSAFIVVKCQDGGPLMIWPIDFGAYSKT